MNPFAPLWLYIAGGLLAIAVVYHARGIVEGAEMRPVREVRDMAMEELVAEAAQVQTEIRALRDEVRSVEHSVRSFVRNPMDALSPTVQSKREHNTIKKGNLLNEGCHVREPPPWKGSANRREWK